MICLGLHDAIADKLLLVEFVMKEFGIELTGGINYQKYKKTVNISFWDHLIFFISQYVKQGIVDKKIIPANLSFR